MFAKKELSFLQSKDSCIGCFRKNKCFIQHVNKDKQSKLNRGVFFNKKYQAGEYLFYQGQLSEYIYIVKTGSLKNFISSHDGYEQVVSFNFAGDLLGLEGIEKTQHVSAVVALEATIVCVVYKEYIEKICLNNPSLLHEIMIYFCHEIERDYQLLMMNSHKTAEQRVAIFLLALLARQRDLNGHKARLFLTMSRADIASYLGLVPATVSRVLTSFEQRQLIMVRKKKLHIKNENALSDISSNYNFCDKSSFQCKEESYLGFLGEYP